MVDENMGNEWERDGGGLYEENLYLKENHIFLATLYPTFIKDDI